MKITIVQCIDDDWCGIYVDGILFREGHSLSVEDGLDAADVLYTYIYNYENERGQGLPNEEASLRRPNRDL